MLHQEEQYKLLIGDNLWLESGSHTKKNPIGTNVYPLSVENPVKYTSFIS